MKGPRERGKPALLSLVLIVGLAAFASTSWAQNRGDCVTSKVPEAFTLPDGTLHAAGRLTLCTVQAFTPVVGLHRVWANGDGASFAMSRLTWAEANADNRPVLLFRRVHGWPLEFVGYVWPDERGSWSYALQRVDPAGIAGPEAFGAVRSWGELVTPP